MLYIAPYTKIPELVSAGIKPKQIVSVAREKLALPLRGMRENRALAPSKSLLWCFSVGGIDEYSFRVLYRDSLTMRIPPARLRQVAEYFGYKVLVGRDTTPGEKIALEVLCDWLAKNGVPCQPWQRTIDAETQSDIW